MTSPPKEDPVRLRIAQIFLGEARFSHRSDALQLDITTPPDVGEVSIAVEVGHDEKNQTLALVLRLQSDSSKRPLYDVLIATVGTFFVDGEVTSTNIDRITKSATSIVFPFAREALANLTSRGRFGPVWLQPINVAEVLRAAKVERDSTTEGTSPISPADEDTPPKRPRRRTT